jgi:hypothetical protein
LSNAFVAEYSSFYFAQFTLLNASLCSIRGDIASSQPGTSTTSINFDSFFFSGFFRARRRVQHGLALVRIELLLNSGLPELTRVGRELRVARFTNSQ